MYQDDTGELKMSVTFTMDISNAKSTNMNGMQNILKQVRFTILATDNVNTVSSYFPVDLNYPDKDNFIEYEKLTQDQIYKWVTDAVGEDLINSLKNGLTSQLKEKEIEDPLNPVLRRINLPQPTSE